MSAQEKTLELLRRKPGYISGEQLSEQLGISRQALWKHMNELKDIGYEIAAVPHLGYKLISAPDKLFGFEISHRLGTHCVGKRIYYYDAVSSTMDIAMRLGMESAPEGTLVVAETQTKGRGRLGRSWFSPKYKGVYFSLILRPDIPPDSATLFALLSAVSVAEAIQEYLGLSVEIKWPNDVLVEGKKVAGILIEASAEMDKIRFLVIGIGLNVNNARITLPEGATSLREGKKERINRVELLKEVLRKLESYYFIFKEKAGAPILKRWREHKTTIGRRVSATVKSGKITGTAVDIDSDGALMVRVDSGALIRVAAGDVVYCR